MHWEVLPRLRRPPTCAACAGAAAQGRERPPTRRRRPRCCGGCPRRARGARRRPPPPEERPPTREEALMRPVGGAGGPGQQAQLHAGRPQALAGLPGGRPPPARDLAPRPRRRRPRSSAGPRGPQAAAQTAHQTSSRSGTLLLLCLQQAKPQNSMHIRHALAAGPSRHQRGEQRPVCTRAPSLPPSLAAAQDPCAWGVPCAHLVGRWPELSRACGASPEEEDSATAPSLQQQQRLRTSRHPALQSRAVELLLEQGGHLTSPCLPAWQKRPTQRRRQQP